MRKTTLNLPKRDIKTGKINVKAIVTCVKPVGNYINTEKIWYVNLLKPVKLKTHKHC